MQQGMCPFCLCSKFREGPSGCGALNIRCSCCGKEYWWSPPFPSMIIERDEPRLYREDVFDMREALGIKPLLNQILDSPKAASFWGWLKGLFR